MRGCDFTGCPSPAVRAPGTPFYGEYWDDSERRGEQALCDLHHAALVGALRTHASLSTVVLPSVFFDDHAHRDLPHGFEVGRSKAGVEILADHDTLNEILSDARHYVGLGVVELGWEYAGLVSSARATVKRLKVQYFNTHKKEAVA